MADDDPNDDGKGAGDDPKDVTALIAEAVEKATAPLRAKNRELLAEAKTAKARAAQFGEMDADEIRDKLDALEDLNAGDNKGDGTEAAVQRAVGAAQRKHERELKRMGEQLAQSTAALDSARAEGRNFLLNSALDSAIGAAKIAEPFRDAVRALQRDRVASLLADEPEVTPEVASRVAAEALQAFAASDAGKHYVQAPVSNGGGARGSAHSASGAVAGAKPVHQMTELEKAQFVDEHGVDAWSKALNASRAAPANVNGGG